MANLESLGTQLNITEDYFDRLAKVLTYDGDGNVNTITASGTFNGVSASWLKTLTWTAGKLTSESEWVKQ